LGPERNDCTVHTSDGGLPHSIRSLRVWVWNTWSAVTSVIPRLENWKTPSLRARDEDRFQRDEDRFQHQKVFQTSLQDGRQTGNRSLRSTGLSKQELIDLTLIALKEAYQAFGGPTAYLQTTYSSPERRVEFARQLYAYFPATDTVDMKFDCDWPSVPEHDRDKGTLLKAHLAMFNYTESGSPNMPTGTKTSLKIAEEVLLDGMLTAGEPIITNAGDKAKIMMASGTTEGVQNAPWHKQDIDPLPVFGINLHKGAGRIRTCLCIASLFLEDGVDLKQLHPVLWQSMRDITVVNLRFATLREQAFSNFKLSARGAIRQAPSVINWVVVLQKLGAAGDSDTGQIIRQWNQGSARANQILGAKAQAVKNVMDLCLPETIALMIDHVSTYTWEGCSIQEDCLASKKVFKGQHFRSVNSRKWTSRQIVTKESCQMMWLRIFKKYDTTVATFRKKYNKAYVEEQAELSACFYNSVVEASENSPLDLEELLKECGPMWVSSDPKLDMELQSGLADKSEQWTFRELTCINNMMLKYSGGKTVDIMKDEAMVEKESQQLEEISFNLLLKQVAFDAQAFRIRASKLASWEKEVYARKLNWNVQRHIASENAAADHVQQWARTVFFDSCDQTVAEFNKFMKEICAKHDCTQQAVIPVGFCNWIAPCSMKSSDLELQANFMAMLSGLSERAIVIVLMPQYTYHKGQLYISENKVTSMMSTRGLNFDHKFALCFESRPDARDNRPLLNDGRIITPAGVKDEEYFWRRCNLMKGKTAEASMLHSRDLVSVSAIGDTSLPDTTDLDSYVKGAAKCQQIGEDGCSKIIDALLEGAGLDSRSPMLFVELNQLTGNFMDAMIQKRQGWNFPSYYFSFTDSNIQFEWFQHTKKAAIKQLHLEGKLVVPGHPVPPNEPPKELLEDPPPMPAFNQLVVKKVKKAGSDQKVEVLVFPPHLVQAWYTHSTLGEKFQEFLEKFHDEFGNYQMNCDDDDDSTGATPGKKRASSSTPSSSAKKAKQDDSKFMVAEKPDGTEILSTPMKAKGQEGLKLHVHMGYNMHISNPTTKEISQTAGSFVAGFGKGKFVLTPNLKEGAPEGILFELKGMDDLIFLNQQLTTVGEAIQQKRASDPTCKIAYHEMAEIEGGSAGDFAVTMKNKVYFGPEASDDKSQAGIAASIPVAHWGRAEASIAMVWSAKWGPNGLTPIRPLILFTSSVTIGPGRFFLITQAESGS